MSCLVVLTITKYCCCQRCFFLFSMSDVGIDAGAGDIRIAVGKHCFAALLVSLLLLWMFMLLTM